MKYLNFNNEKHKLDFYTESAIREQVKRTNINKDVITEAYNMLFQCVLEEIRKGSIAGPQKYKSIHIPKLGTFLPKKERLEFLKKVYCIKTFKTNNCKFYDDFYGVCILISEMAFDIDKMNEVINYPILCKKPELQALGYLLNLEDSLFLKKLGYNENVGTYYLNNSDNEVYFECIDNSKTIDNKILAPTYVQVFDWIKVKYKYKVEFNSHLLSYTIYFKNKYKPEKKIVTNFISNKKCNFIEYKELSKGALHYIFNNLISI